MNKITERGLHVIKQWERFRPIAYKDGPTESKGFGHSRLLTTVDFDEKPEWTEAYAHEVLLLDLEYFASLLRPHLKIEIPDEIWSVCMSLVYNKGVSRLVQSDQWKILNDASNKRRNEKFCDSIRYYAVIGKNRETGVIEELDGLRWRRIAEAGIYLQDRLPGYYP